MKHGTVKSFRQPPRESLKERVREKKKKRERGEKREIHIGNIYAHKREKKGYQTFSDTDARVHTKP